MQIPLAPYPTNLPATARVHIANARAPDPTKRVKPLRKYVNIFWNVVIRNARYLKYLTGSPRVHIANARTPQTRETCKTPAPICKYISAYSKFPCRPTNSALPNARPPVRAQRVKHLHAAVNSSFHNLPLLRARRQYAHPGMGETQARAGKLTISTCILPTSKLPKILYCNQHAKMVKYHALNPANCHF